MGFRHDEFSELEAGREESNQGSRYLRLDGHGNRQGEKARGQAQSCEQKETQQPALRDSVEF